MPLPPHGLPPCAAFVEQTLICDFGVFVAALLASRFLVERGIRFVRRRSVPGSERPGPSRPPLVTVPTKGLLLGVLFGLLNLTLYDSGGWVLGAGSGRAVGRALDTLNAPAVWLRNRWLDSLSPPANRALAGSVAPFLTVLVLWGLVGLAVGVVASYRVVREEEVWRTGVSRDRGGEGRLSSAFAL